MRSTEAKLRRADEHIETLNRETDDWGDTDPLDITRESNADGSQHVFRLRFKTEPDLPRSERKAAPTLLNGTSTHS